MPHISTEDGKLFYAWHRAKDARHQVILLHGAGGSRLVWPAEFRRFPRTEVFVLDLPGHGRSSLPGRDTIEGYASVVLGFIEMLDLRNVILMGHSMGGAIAQTICTDQHPFVVGAVLLGTGARLRVTKEIQDRILTDFEGTVSTIAGYCWAPDAPKEFIVCDKQRILEVPPQVLYGDYQACDGFDLMNDLSRIKVPTLVISGSEDVMTPVKYGRFLAENIPNAQFAVIEGGGHHMALEQPERVAEVVREFLNGI